MPLDSKSLVRQVLQLQAEAVTRWHNEPIDNPYTGILGVVCQQHAFNYQLWHEEDVARSRDVTDERIAQVKRAIDGFNQQRNDWIERIDETLLEMLGAAGVEAPAEAPLNTETPGSAIDRLSIMSLRVYHLHEEFEREGANDAHRQRVGERLARCAVQTEDLSGSLTDLLGDIIAGQKRLRVYRQMKMYNDPTLNPYLYKSTRKAG
ncbi:DUF4254 domain-containing protein [Botrimarina hoheduenensis]|uniref:DUF4254 domain-containing protein n=1 Tax=Botrimarina hoheduenensis TaxID=2528000 RepID=A0A5C5WCG7_9BACT|nr:DUF4254 domain-containing protein [Botrimarina hoheduenensis]TWT47362.1 hypothetical protein Pla111_09750 [Botrimarina hoheduenensis]